jgi:ribosomal protein L21
MHFRKMFDEKYIGSWDLDETPEVVVTIKDVRREELKANAGAEVAHKPVLYFEKTEKGMVCNKTNAKTIADAYGPDVKQWRGKKITIYKEKVRAFGSTHDALRVRAGGREQCAAKTKEAPGADDVGF